MATSRELLNQALEHHRQGDLQRAVEFYRQVLQLEPEHIDTLCCLGIAYLSLGQPKESVTCYEHVLRLQPEHVGALCDVAIAYAHLGRLDEAAASLRASIRLRPDHAEALNNLGVVLTQQGKFEAAVETYQNALRLKPDYAEGHNNLGLALVNLGRLEEAAASFREALRVRPDYTDAYNSLQKINVELWKQAAQARPQSAETLNDLGVSYANQGNLDEAVASYRKALQVNPNYAEAHNNLGVALRDLGKLDEGIASLRESLRIKPEFAPAHNNLALALADKGKLDEAEAHFREAIRILPNYAEAYNNLGVILRDKCKLDECRACFETALQLKPDYAAPRLNRSLLNLLQGNFEQGWPEYEWRWTKKGMVQRPFRQPLWDGSPLEGRIILIHAEQGLGDTLQFIRYVPLVKEKGGRVLVECQPALNELIRTCPGVDEVVSPPTPLPPFDVHVPLLSLPRILGTTLKTIPAKVPYLFPPPQLVERWKREIGSIRAYKIGISWQGDPKHESDLFRSVPLTRFGLLARSPGVHLFSLQKGPGAEQLRDVTVRFGVTDLGSRFGSFADTAAAMKNLDLIISVDSAVAHCAGALGIPVWVFLPASPDWRWMLNREDSPWYPTMRLFRQKELNNWQAVFERIQKALSERVAVIRRGGTVK